jgi:hypothetical protein
MEHLLSPSRRGFSVRSILAFVLIVFVTMVLWTLGAAQPANAAGDTDANWSGESIIYDEHGYTVTDDFKDTTNTIPDGASVYLAPLQTQGSDAKKALVLYFTPGLDPPTAETAKYVEFSVADNGDWTNDQNAKDITVTPQGESSEYTSCSVGGIGWIICPVSIFIANRMDDIFNVLSQLISVQPSVLGDSNNGMYIAWNVMRNIANVAFVIAFLIIIYSQLSNFGVSNYGIKKLVPRLIIAAVLVNVSFIISAIAIDISNVLGYSIQNVFNAIRENVFNLTDDNFGGLNLNPWTSVTALVLGGGGVIGGTYFAATGGLVLIIPLLVGLILTLVFVVIVLAARQAIIVILVIIAPIAFVANLLPNTEKWFDKWKDLFMTMLIFFPAFSLVFGGSQLAGQLIIQNAGDSIVSVIFGMAVQIAPLVITPLLLKFSGSLLGRIAQIANNPSKGVLDRTKNWANDRAEFAKQRNIGQGARWYNPASYGSRMVRNSDFRKRQLKSRTDNMKQLADNRFHETDMYHKLHDAAQGADLDKQRIEKTNNARTQRAMSKNGTVLNIKTVELDAAKTAEERATARTTNMISGYRTGSYDTQNSAHLEELQRTMAENVIQTAAWQQGDENNQYVQKRNISNRMRTDQALLNNAQGYGSAELQEIGRERAQASAVATLTKLNQDARGNIITLMQTEAVESKMQVPVYAKEKIFNLAKSSDSAVRSQVSKNRLEAALEIMAQDGQMSVFDDARENEYIDQGLIDAVVARNVPTFKQKGGFHTQSNPGLSLQRYLEAFNSGDYSYGNNEQAVRNKFKADLSIARLGTLSNTTAEHFKDVKAGTFESYARDMKDLLKAVPVDNNNKPLNDDDKKMLERIHEAFRGALSDEQTRLGMTDRLAPARAIEEILRQKFYTEAPVLKQTEAERNQAGGGKISATDIDTNFKDIDPTAGSPSDTGAPK